MDNRVRNLGVSSLLVILSLYVVGIVSHGIIRHFVQTAPVWPAVVLAFRRSPWAKWAALSPLLLWLLLMINIWLLLLGLPHLLSGTFSPIEIVLTIIIGLAAMVGVAIALRIRTSVSWAKALGVLVLMLGLQFFAIWLSFKPGINRDPWYRPGDASTRTVLPHRDAPSQVGGTTGRQDESASVRRTGSATIPR